MRGALFLLAAATLAAPPAGAADLPPFVFQIKPVGQIISDVKAGAKLIAGDAAAKQVDAAIQQAFGDKGLTGIDQAKPIVGYVVPGAKAADPKKVPVIVAVPITGEKEFVELVGRTAKVEPVTGKTGVYRVTDNKMPPKKGPAGAAPAPKGDAEKPELMVVRDKYAYLGNDAPDDAFEPANLVDPDKLEMPNETALFALRVYFDRLPEETHKQIGDAIDAALRDVENAPLPPDAGPLAKQASEITRRMAARYLTQAKEASEAVLRVRFDPATGEAAVEAGLTGQKGSTLAKDIAARKPSTNQFAGLITKDTAVGLTLSAPLFSDELRDLYLVGIDAALAKAEDLPESYKPIATDALKGLKRTVRTGTLDFAASVRGPDKAGRFGAVAALSFEDTAALETSIRAALMKELPEEFKPRVTFAPAGKGTVVYTVRLDGLLPPEAAKGLGPVYGAAVAFTPKAIYAAFGADPRTLLKTATAATARPAPARALDLTVNPVRAARLATLTGDPAVAGKASEALGSTDTPLSALFVSLEGGQELRVKIGMNLRLFGKAAVGLVPGGAGPPPPVPAPKEKE